MARRTASREWGGTSANALDQAEAAGAGGAEQERKAGERRETPGGGGKKKGGQRVINSKKKTEASQAGRGKKEARGGLFIVSDSDLELQARRGGERKKGPRLNMAQTDPT